MNHVKTCNTQFNIFYAGGTQGSERAATCEATQVASQPRSTPSECALEAKRTNLKKTSYFAATHVVLRDLVEHSRSKSRSREARDFDDACKITFPPPNK